MAAENINIDHFKQIQEIFADLFEVPPKEVSTDIQFGDLPKWDSMGHMDLMVALESHFAIEISAETISELISVASILEKIEAGQNG